MFRTPKYKVRYRHLLTERSWDWDEIDRLESEHNMVFRGVRAITVCTILRTDTWHEVGYGLAWCRFPDQFSPKVGRKLAFTRAVLSPHLTKDERREMWAAFFKAEGLPYGKREEASGYVGCGNTGCCGCGGCGSDDYRDGIAAA